MSIHIQDKPLKVRVASISATHAKLVFSDSQSVEINPKFLPKDTKSGTTLYLNLLTDEDLDKSREELAKAVLDEILK